MCFSYLDFLEGWILNQIVLFILKPLVLNDFKQVAVVNFVFELSTSFF